MKKQIALLSLITISLFAYPANAGTIYAGTDAGLEISTNGGSTWTPSSWKAKVNAVVTTAPLYTY